MATASVIGVPNSDNIDKYSSDFERKSKYNYFSDNSNKKNNLGSDLFCFLFIWLGRHQKHKVQTNGP